VLDNKRAEAAIKARRIFVSSPGDVSEERALAESVLRRLGEEYRESVQLSTILWEHEPIFAHAGFQEQIARPSQCDLVICILWSRLGSRLPEGFAPGLGEAALTGTEFEIRDALGAYRAAGKPNLLIYRKTVAPQLNMASADARERLRQYELLDEFCRRTFYDEHGAIVVAHTTYAESYEFEKKLVEHVRRWLAQQVGDAEVRARWTTGSPYRGLQPFEAEHREIYFGRAQSLSELIARLRDTETRDASNEPPTRFLLVQGMSGSGKSSLIRAGLLPLLEGRALEGIVSWRQVILKPSDRSDQWPDAGVVGAMVAALAKAIPAIGRSYPDLGPLAERVRTAPGESAARLDGYLTQEAMSLGLRPDQIRLVVFIDQLEEIFEQRVLADERLAFIAMLDALAREGRVWVIATVRSDFASRLEEHPQFVNLTRDGHLYILGPPQADELAEMIREPAQAAGLQWETRDGVSLDQAILREATANPEGLPLLEYVLDQLYERHSGRWLTYAAYQELGGLKGGVAQSAEAVLAAQQAVASSFPNLMRSLVSVDENGTATRRYAPLAELPPGTPERALLDALIAHRFCVADRRGDEAVASFAHEALISSWPRVTHWLKDEAGLLQTRELAVRDARLWQQHGESDAWLATADKLISFKALESAHMALPQQATHFIERSRRRAVRAKRTKQLIMAGIVVLAVTAMIFGIYAQRARNVASRAIAAQFEVKAWDLLRAGNLPSALRYALGSTIIAGSAGDTSPPLLTASLLQTSRTTVLTGHTDQIRLAAFSVDGRRVITASEDHTARIWDTATGREIARLKHANKVWQAAFSRDGTRIITASGDNRARIWDASSGKQLAELQHGDKNSSSVLVAVFSPDAMKAATVSSDGTAWIWNLQSGKDTVHLQDGTGLLELIRAVQANIVLELQNKPATQAVPTMTGIRTVAFSPDGREVVTASTGGTARVWNADTGEPRLVLKHDDVVFHAEFSHDGRRLVTASKDHTARLWDAASGGELARFGHDASVSRAVFSPDGRQIVTASDDGTARVWDATDNYDVARAYHERRQRRDTFLPPEIQRMKTAIARVTSGTADPLKNRELALLQLDGKVTEAAFSSDGKLIVTASEDHTARIWDDATGGELARLQHSAGVETAAFSPNGETLVTTSQGNIAQIWQVARTLGESFQHDADVQTAAFSRDGRHVLTSSIDHVARVWDASSGRQLAQFNDRESVRAAEFSADGRRVVTVAGDASVWDVFTGQEVAHFQHSIADVRQASFSPDGASVLTAGGTDYTARIWDVARDRERLRLIHDGVVNAAAFSPKGTRVLTASGDHTARVWDALTGKELVRLQHDQAVRQAAFSADGQRIVTASDDHTAALWDAQTGRQLARLHHDNRDGVVVRSAAFSLDGTRVVTASSDNTARVWAVADGRELARFRHDNAVLSASFFPDGRRVLTASSDHTARIWDVVSGRELLLLQRASHMREAVISPNGKLALTAADDAARLWDLSPLTVQSPALNIRDCAWLPADQRHFGIDEIQSDALVREVFLAGQTNERNVCEGNVNE
jgi:WD40 repeat protein